MKSVCSVNSICLASSLLTLHVFAANELKNYDSIRQGALGVRDPTVRKQRKRVMETEEWEADA